MPTTIRSTQPDSPPGTASIVDDASDPARERFWLRGLRAGRGVELRVVDPDNNPLTVYKAIEISATGIGWKQAVRAKDTAAADTGSYTYDPNAEGGEQAPVWTGVTTAPTWDGVTLADGDRILITEASDARGRGIFVYDATAQGFRRANDADNTPGNEFGGGVAVLVLEGNTHAGSAWIVTAPEGQANFGADSLTFAQFGASGGSGVVEGTGIDVTGGVVSVDWANAPVTTTVADTDLLMLKTATGHEAVSRLDFLKTGFTNTQPDTFKIQIESGAPGPVSGIEITNTYVKPFANNTINLACSRIDFNSTLALTISTFPPFAWLYQDPGLTNILLEFSTNTGTTDAAITVRHPRGLRLGGGTTAQRASGSGGRGVLHYNTDLGRLEIYDATGWTTLATSRTLAAKEWVLVKDAGPGDTSAPGWSYNAATDSWTTPAAPVFDGISIGDKARVLITEATDARGNGVWVHDAVADTLTRAPDADQGAILAGAIISVSDGATMSGTVWKLSSPGFPTLGTDSLSFTQIKGSVAGDGINITGETVSIDWTTLPFVGGNPTFMEIAVYDSSFGGHKRMTRQDFVAGADIWAVDASPDPPSPWRVGYGPDLDIAFDYANDKMVFTTPGTFEFNKSAGVPEIDVIVNGAFYVNGADEFVVSTPGGFSEFSGSELNINTQRTSLRNIVQFVEVDPATLRLESTAAGLPTVMEFYSTGSAPPILVGNDKGLVIGSGDTATRPGTPPTATVRFNTDTNRIEYYNGTAWKQYVPADDWSYAKVTYTGTNPIPGFFAFAPFSKNTVHVYVNRTPLMNEEFDIVNGTDLQIIGFTVNNGDTVWAKYA